MTVPQVAVLASGRGSNFQAILRAIRAGTLQTEIVALVSDKAGAPALEIARQAGIPALEVLPPPAQTGEDPILRRKKHDEKILKALGPFSPRFLVMAGYMRVISPVLLDAFRSVRGYSRIVNIHPSLLPAFPGIHSYRKAYEYGVKWTGVTVHLAEEAVDSGPICAQEAFSIADCKSAEEVEKRGLDIEHRLYPETLNWVLPEKFEIETRVSQTGRISVRPR
jgi:phosphoribosylglycinamide formyltransferase-1